MRANGGTTRLMGSEFTLTVMGLAMKENGSKIYNTEKGTKVGLMGQSLQESIWRGAKMELENTSGQMAHVMKANGRKTRSQAMGTINGLMAENILAIGRAI